MTPETDRKARLRAFFAHSDDPYAGGDIEVARRLSAVLWRVGVVLTLVLVPVAPPTEAVGSAGWAYLGVIALIGIAGARWILHRGVSWNFLLIASYLSVVQLAIVEWLAGGSSSPFSELYLLIALPAGAMHPPHRVAGVLGAIGVAMALPLVYEPASPALIGTTVLQFILLSAIALTGAGLMKQVRAQRLGLREDGERAERLARVDELTGLPNRRAFSEALATEISRSRRFGTPLSLIIGDLDDFKRINDEHGHPAGDACLQAVGDALKATLRQYDTCFRWGGDEFALLLPATTGADAQQVVFRVAAAVGECCDAGGARLKITSAAAQLTDDMNDGDDLLAAADAALLERKRARGARLLRSA